MWIVVHNNTEIKFLHDYKFNWNLFEISIIIVCMKSDQKNMQSIKPIEIFNFG